MRLRTLSTAAMVVILSGLFSFGQEAMLQPGKEHAKLKELEGKWTFVLTTPDGSESKGTSEYKVECGGFWLTSDFNTDFGGMKFQGKGLDSYDPIKKKYVSVWVDSLTTYPMTFEGDYDASGKVLTMNCDGRGPTGKPAKWRSVSTFISADEHKFEMYLTPEGGKEMQMMTVVYKRTK